MKAKQFLFGESLVLSSLLGVAFESWVLFFLLSVALVCLVQFSRWYILICTLFGLFYGGVIFSIFSGINFVVAGLLAVLVMAGSLIQRRAVFAYPRNQSGTFRADVDQNYLFRHSLN